MAWARSLTGKMPIELEEAVDCPAGFEYLWDWFMRLNAVRPKGMGAVSGIPETEIRAYFKNRGIWPEAWELRIIERLDYVALEASQSESHNQSQDQ